MQRVICNKREYFAITEVDEVAPGKVLGFRADHDFTAGPASLVVIPVASPQPWEGPRLAFDTIDEFGEVEFDRPVPDPAAGSSEPTSTLPNSAAEDPGDSKSKAAA